MSFRACLKIEKVPDFWGRFDEENRGFSTYKSARTGQKDGVCDFSNNRPHHSINPRFSKDTSLLLQPLFYNYFLYEKVKKQRTGKYPGPLFPVGGEGPLSQHGTPLSF